MPNQRLQYLFDQYTEGNCTPAEKRELYALALTLKNDADVQELLDKYWDDQVIEFRMPEDKAEGIVASILDNESKVVPRIHRIHFRRSRWWAAAAIIIMLATGSYFMFFNKGDKKGTEVVKTNVPAKDIEAPKETKATITLADGRTISIDSLTTIDQANVEVRKTVDGQIAYSGTGKEMVFNTLTNPKGSKVIDLVLNDGSHVWLNAGSSLTYPVGFIGNDRNVSITGEAYFEVTHDSRPFSVSKGDVVVQVLGTKFNVNAYDDEASVRVTLLEGSVRTSMVNGEWSILKPGEQAQIANSIKVVRGVDLEEVIAWKNGLFSFTRADIKTIMRQLARWYDLEVSYEGRISEREFGGEMQRDLPLSSMIRLLEKGKFHFRQDGRKLVVLP